MSIPIMVILFFGIGLPLSAFLSGLYYLKKNEGREKRVSHVVRQMMDGPHDSTNLLHRLFLSGVLDLENSKEIVEVCYRVEKKEGENPIPENCGLSPKDLKSFFIYVSLNKIDLSNTTIQKVIKGYKEKKTFNAAA